MPNNWDFEQAQQMGQFWFDMISKMGSSFTSTGPGAPPPEAARQIRGTVFKAMAEQLDQYMRSETFLQGMKSTLDQTMDFQEKFKTTLTQMRHATEGVAEQDIAAIMTNLRQFESRVLDRLEDLQTQMTTITQRLDSQADPQNGAVPAKRPAPAKPAAGERRTNGNSPSGSK